MKENDYSAKLKSPKWQKKRLEIFRRDKFTCKLCKDTETSLHVHHKEYINGNDPWDYENDQLITLCEDCHTEIEKLKKDEPDIYFEQIKVYKADNWKGGSKIIFVAYPGTCSMKIYDDQGKWVCGYNFTEDTSAIIKILKYSQNG